MFVLDKKNILTITSYLILSSIMNTPLYAEHDFVDKRDYIEFAIKKEGDIFDNKGQESLEFGPLAIKRGSFFECKDGRNIKDGGDSSLPISPSQFLKVIMVRILIKLNLYFYLQKTVLLQRAVILQDQ